MENLNNESMNELVSMTDNELVAIDGGYSWAEFKQDVGDFVDGIADGFNNPRK